MKTSLRFSNFWKEETQVKNELWKLDDRPVFVCIGVSIYGN
jgi:hypothetical protein